MGYSNPPFGMPNSGTPGNYGLPGTKLVGELETNQFKIRCLSFVWPEVFFSKSLESPIVQLPEDIFCEVKHGDGKTPDFWTILGI
jgi:hypothetical protein